MKAYNDDDAADFWFDCLTEDEQQIVSVKDYYHLPWSTRSDNIDKFEAYQKEYAEWEMWLYNPMRYYGVER